MLPVVLSALKFQWNENDINSSQTTNGDYSYNDSWKHAHNYANINQLIEKKIKIEQLET